MAIRKNKKNWIVYISTYPPRECGIATFTEDLVKSFDSLYWPREESKVVALDNSETTDSPLLYPKNKVIETIKTRNREEYARLAETLNNMSQVKLVNIQHEFGIYGGELGEYLIDFMKACKKPLVITMHTVLPSPTDKMKQVVQDLSLLSAKVVVMTETSRKILLADYGIPEIKIVMIPHGIHPLSFTDGHKEKKLLKLHGKTVISTFGLLSKGKGNEYAIEALPEVVKKFPDLLYLIIGATHPEVKKREGEVYRQSLEERVKALGLEEHVLFVNKYLSIHELLRYLEATDIYLAVPLDPHQAVSGTLSYALGAGRPVVATSFAQAKEIITREVGRLVGFRNPADIRDALIELLQKKELRADMSRRAYFRTRSMVWKNVMLGYMREYINLVPELRKIEKNVPPVKIRHFMKLTDDFGMFQFAKLTEPDPDWGYTLDDNARAMIAMAMYYEHDKTTIPLKLIRTYLSFISYTARPEGGFHNYVNYDKTFHDERNTKENLDDANARAFYALALVASRSSLPDDIRAEATRIFKAQFVKKREASSVRSMAFFIKAFSRWLSVESDSDIENLMKRYADKLVEAYKTQREANWEWFEDSMTYSNALLPDALLTAFRKTGNSEYFDTAKITLEFLINYSFTDTICTPIGQNGWFRRGGQRYSFDQQPEEVAALVSALSKMYRITKSETHRQRMYQAFNWFLGNNTLGQFVYDQVTGGCYDGVGEKEVNLNQGAESTVVYLIARLSLA